MQREYQNVIFTEHALERIKQRRITQKMIAQAIKKPDSQFVEDDGDTRFIREISERNVHVVSRYLDDEGKWLVISAWVRGEDDLQPLWKRLLGLPLRAIQKLTKSRRRS